MIVYRRYHRQPTLDSRGPPSASGCLIHHLVSLLLLKVSFNQYIVLDSCFLIHIRNCSDRGPSLAFHSWEYGFRCLIGVSYSEIFYNNCINNGILIFTLESEKINDLFESVEANAGRSMNINLIQQEIITPEGNSMHFEIDEFHKFCLVNGIDQIDWTLQFEDLILQHEKKLKMVFLG